MKRQLEEVAGKAHESQMNELKRMRPRSFRRKGHEQQYKHNEKVKAAVYRILQRKVVPFDCVGNRGNCSLCTATNSPHPGAGDCTQANKYISLLEAAAH